MKKVIKLSLLTLFLCLGLQPIIWGQSQANRMLIQLSETGRANLKMDLRANQFSTGISELDAINNQLGAYYMEPLYDIPPAERKLAQQLGMDRHYILYFESGTDLEDAQKNYHSLSTVANARPTYKFKMSTLESEMPEVRPETPDFSSGLPCGVSFPNDPMFCQQWSHYNPSNNYVPRFGDGVLVGLADCDSDVKDAWNITTGSSSVIFANLDLGIDTNHEDFKTNSGAPRIIGGFNFEDNNTDIHTSTSRHGNWTSGIAAATGNNNKGVAGVDWKAEIMMLRVSTDGFVDVVNVCRALRYAADNGARVVNMSFGYQFGQPSDFTQDSLNFLQAAANYADARNVVMFAATGNDDKNVAEYPAALPNVIGVGAMSPCCERKGGGLTAITCDNDTRIEVLGYEWGSNYGPSVQILAPATLLPTVGTGGGYDPNSYGTSIASPYLAGVACLMLSVNPQLTDEDITEILYCTADDVGAAGYDIFSGNGRVNALRAVTTAQTWNSLPANLTIQNQNISTSELFQAINTITVGPSVNITQPTANVEFIAGNSITFKANFTMVSGAELHASLDDPCSNGRTSANEPPVEEIFSLNREAEKVETVSPTLSGQLRVYPNPFREEVKVDVEVKEEGQFDLGLYNVYGQQIAMPISGQTLTVGTHTLAIPIDNLPAGTYFYQARLGAEQFTGRMIRVE